MSAEMAIPLTFATFYLCAVKDLTTFNQRISVNILLKNIYPEKGSYIDSETLTDVFCSNYSKGKRPLNSNLQKELNELSEKDAIERLEKLGIQDKTNMANALRTLVKYSSLSENEKRELLESFQTEDNSTFIAKVFLKSVKGNNHNPVTNAQIKTLEQYKTQSILSDGKNSDSTISENQKSVNEPNMDFFTVSGSCENLIGEGTRLSHSKLEYDEFDLPNDYQRIIAFIKTSIKNSNLLKFQMNEVIEAMDIDAVCNNLKEGYLEYWQVEGKIEHILAPFRRIDFKDVSAFAIHLIGQFDLLQSETIEHFFRNASNDNVTILTSLCYKEGVDIKLILLVHRNKRKSTEQKLDSEHDGTRVYIKNSNSKSNPIL